MLLDQPYEPMSNPINLNSTQNFKNKVRLSLG